MISVAKSSLPPMSLTPFSEPFDNDMEEDDIIEEDDDVIEEDDVIDSENDYEGNVDLDVVEALAALPSSLSNHPTSTRSPNGVNGGRASATPKLSTTDSAFSSNQDVSSRRASTHSNPIPIPNFVNALPIVNNDPKEFRGRRQTIGTRPTSKWPNLVSRKKSLNGNSRNRKNSETSSSSTKTEASEDCDDFFKPQESYYKRRFSVPEKVLLNANYAILRQRKEGLEVVGAFNKNGEAYKEFMQSLTCYDIAPTHGVVVLLDAQLTILKAVTALCSSGHPVGLISNIKNQDNYGILTLTDCLSIIQIAADGNSKLGDQTLQYFLDNHNGNRKRVVTAYCTQSVWDVSRLFRMNRVHRIPVMQGDEFTQSQDALYLLCLRQIFSEVILKLLDSKCSLTPNLRGITLESIKDKIGTWSNLASISENVTCGEAISKILARKVSCLPILDNQKQIVGIVNKNDIMNAVGRHDKNYIKVIGLPVTDIVSPTCLKYLAHYKDSLEEVIRKLHASQMQCIFVTSEENSILYGVVSYADFMDFVFKFSEKTLINPSP